MPPPSQHDVVMQRLHRIFGPERANRLADSILGALGISSLRTTGDLIRFATELEAHGTFEGAVAAMLRVQALINETQGPRSD